jgi:hypothetical protein
MSDEPLASVDTDTADCRHPVRVRDIYLGFASAETVCVTCALDRAGRKERACP